MKINEFDKEVTQKQLDILEMYIDKVFNKLGIDVEFTRHFLDRVNDERNVKQITIKELGALFAKEYKRWGKPIAQMGPDKEAVMKDLESDINIPFALNWDRNKNQLELVAKTVMRKKNFRTPNKEFPVENAQLDELSPETLTNYIGKASDARGHRDLPAHKVDNRYAGVARADIKLNRLNRDINRGDFVSYAGRLYRVFGFDGSIANLGEYYGNDSYGGTKDIHISKLKKVAPPQDIKEHDDPSSYVKVIRKAGYSVYVSKIAGGEGGLRFEVETPSGKEFEVIERKTGHYELYKDGPTLSGRGEVFGSLMDAIRAVETNNESINEDLGSIPPLTDLIIMAVVGQTTVGALKAAFKAGKYALKLKRLADKAGVKLNNAVMGEQGVAESAEQVAISVRKGRNKFATEMTVNGESAGSYQYDANTGRSIAEVDPKYKGKGYGKILVLHAIYTAAMSGMDFVEDESRTSEYDNVLDSLDSNGYAINDDGYWYVTEEGEQFLKQALKQGVAEAAYSYVDILSDDLPDGIDYDFNNLPKVNWSQYSKEDIEKFVEYLYNLDSDDYEGHYGSTYIKAIRWIEKNILKLSEGILDDIKTRHRIKSRIKDFELDREDNDKFGLQNPRQDRAERRLRKKLGKQIPPRLSPDQTRNAEYQEAVNRDEYAKTNLDDYYMDVAKTFKKENPKLKLSGLGWTKKGMIAVKDMNGDEWEYNPRTRKLTLMTEAVNRDEYAATLAAKQQDKFFAAALAALDRLVKSDPRGQDVGGYAFDIARAFQGIDGRELVRAYNEVQ